MRASEFPLNTLREAPADTVIVSHQLMLRAGMIKFVAAGVYTWMPLGLRVLQKIERLVRKYMNDAGAIEILMPFVQPSSLWEESGRLQDYGPDLARFPDRRGREFCLGPTHEEVITDMAREILRNVDDFPVNYYQIQLKFRDEIRPRFGLLRCREFIMKDSYSFHLDDASLDVTYQKMRKAYEGILNELELNYCVVAADTGSIGGTDSHEFQVIAETGEDTIVLAAPSNGSVEQFAANRELVLAPRPSQTEKTKLDGNAHKAIEKFATPNATTIAALAENFDIPANESVKTLFLQGQENKLVAAILRGDHELNPVLAGRCKEVATPLQMADGVNVQKVIGAHFGSLGPVSLPSDITILVDPDVAAMPNFVCGANEDGFHFRNVVLERDVPRYEVIPLRYVNEGETSSQWEGGLTFQKGIEVGHIFKLGDKYTTAMNMQVPDAEQNLMTPQMGCYGFGVSRLVAAIIEQCHDDKGIVWPSAVAPFDVHIITIPTPDEDTKKALEVASNTMMETLKGEGYEAYWDDRDKRMGVKMVDAELIGCPHLVILGKKNFEMGNMEYRFRGKGETEILPFGSVQDLLKCMTQNSLKKKSQ